MQKIRPFLWFQTNVEEAVKFYTSVFKDAQVKNVNPQSAEIVLGGQELMLFNGGPMYSFTPAISLFIYCETQEEIDELWSKLTEGGKESRCGWLEDKFGLSWQVVPTILPKLLFSEDREKAQKAQQAMLSMGKLNIAELEAAYNS